MIIYLIAMLLISMQVISADLYQPNSGDKELDEYLVQINKKINKKSRKNLSKFVDKVSQEFQVPPQKVEELFNHYEFNAPDVLMSVSIADVSGEPLQNIAGVYYKNKTQGWSYTLQQLNIRKTSKVFIQIKNDVKLAL